MRVLPFRSVLIACMLAAGCDSRSPARTRTASDTGARDDRAQFEEPGAIRFGWRGPGKGGGFSVSVGKDFGPAQAEEVLRRLVTLDSSGAFTQFACSGDGVPHFGFDLTLHQEGPVQERIVSLGYVPYPQPWGRERCLNLGFDYLVERTFAQVDTGPPVDYGYKNPSTGETLEPWSAGERHARWWPTCHCEQRDSVQEWVTNGEKETSIGANAH